jgi:hypothetical protein
MLEDQVFEVYAAPTKALLEVRLDATMLEDQVFELYKAPTKALLEVRLEDHVFEV